MLKKRFTPAFHVFTCMLILVAFTMLAPCSGQAMDLRFGNWEIDGFLRNNTGVWTEDWDYALNNDPLATCRNWFRLNLNGAITRNLRLKAEILAIYEPDYPRERHGVDGVTPIDANYYNYFDFRELRLDWRPKPGHYLRIGRQIVNWGESISARVGDVINPVDNRFDLGFTNLEDTRMPIWMIRGIHKFRTIHTSVDWIFSPYMQPDRYRVTRQPSTFGHYNIDDTWVPGPRFGAYHLTLDETLDYFGATGPVWHELAPGTVVPAGVAIPILTAGAATTMPVSGAPFDRMYEYRPANYGGNGEPAGLYWVGIPNPATPSDYPDSSLGDARWGVKTSSTIKGWQTGLYFWSANEMNATFRILGTTILTPNLSLLDIQTQFPRQNVYGFYTNKNFDFGVLRFDAAYRPNREYNTLDRTVPSGIVEKDFLMVQVGFNKDMMIRKINPNQAFSFVFEYVLEYFMEDTDQACVPTYFIEYPRDMHTLFFNASTNYNFGKYSYDLTVIYNSEECGLVQPSFTYVPDWMNRQWSFKLQYSIVFGPDYSYPYGLLKEKDMVVLTTQFSFPN